MPKYKGRIKSNGKRFTLSGFETYLFKGTIIKLFRKGSVRQEKQVNNVDFKNKLENSLKTALNLWQMRDKCIVI